MPHQEGTLFVMANSYWLITCVPNILLLLVVVLALFLLQDTSKNYPYSCWGFKLTLNARNCIDIDVVNNYTKIIPRW